MEHHEPFAALIGLDWSDHKHDLCLVDTETGSHELSVIWWIQVVSATLQS